VESRKGAITADRLRPLVEQLLTKITENPVSVRVEMKALFPAGITLIPPKDGTRGPWQVNLTIDGSKFVCLDTHRRGNADNSRPRYSKPPDLSEGREFSESALGSALSPRHGHRPSFVPPKICHTDSMKTIRNSPKKSRRAERA